MTVLRREIRNFKKRHFSPISLCANL
ncbi:MAG: hypothetical protein JWM11_6406, partial [Planctomycetaceae bacterium]|nr:hypothetical protein [Planctomycetaceae bacterium]